MAGRFTKEQAKIAAEMLNDGQRLMMRALCIRADAVGIPEDTPQSLIEMGLVRKDTNLMDGQEIWLLTETGKRVAKQL